MSWPTDVWMPDVYEGANKAASGASFFCSIADVWLRTCAIADFGRKSMKTALRIGMHPCRLGFTPYRPRSPRKRRCFHSFVRVIGRRSSAGSMFTKRHDVRADGHHRPRGTMPSDDARVFRSCISTVESVSRIQ